MEIADSGAPAEGGELLMADDLEEYLTGKQAPSGPVPVRTGSGTYELEAYLTGKTEQRAPEAQAAPQA